MDIHLKYIQNKKDQYSMNDSQSDMSYQENDENIDSPEMKENDCDATRMMNKYSNSYIYGWSFAGENDFDSKSNANTDFMHKRVNMSHLE